MGQSASLFFSQLSQIGKIGQPALKTYSNQNLPKGVSFDSVLNQLSGKAELNTQSAKSELYERIEKVLSQTDLKQLTEISENIQVVKLPRGSVTFDENGKPVLSEKALPDELKSLLSDTANGKQTLGYIQLSDEDLETLESGNKSFALGETFSTPNRLLIQPKIQDAEIETESGAKESKATSTIKPVTLLKENVENTEDRLSSKTFESSNNRDLHTPEELTALRQQGLNPIQDSPVTHAIEQTLFTQQQSFFADNQVPKKPAASGNGDIKSEKSEKKDSENSLTQRFDSGADNSEIEYETTQSEPNADTGEENTENNQDTIPNYYSLKQAILSNKIPFDTTKQNDAIEAVLAEKESILSLYKESMPPGQEEEEPLLDPKEKSIETSSEKQSKTSDDNKIANRMEVKESVRTPQPADNLTVRKTSDSAPKKPEVRLDSEIQSQKTETSKKSNELDITTTQRASNNVPTQPAFENNSTQIVSEGLETTAKINTPSAIEFLKVTNREPIVIHQQETPSVPMTDRPSSEPFRANLESKPKSETKLNDTPTKPVRENISLKPTDQNTATKPKVPFETNTLKSISSETNDSNQKEKPAGIDSKPSAIENESNVSQKKTIDRQSEEDQPIRRTQEDHSQSRTILNNKQNNISILGKNSPVKENSPAVRSTEIKAAEDRTGETALEPSVVPFVSSQTEETGLKNDITLDDTKQVKTSSQKKTEFQPAIPTKPLESADTDKPSYADIVSAQLKTNGDSKPNVKETRIPESADREDPKNESLQETIPTKTKFRDIDIPLPKIDPSVTTKHIDDTQIRLVTGNESIHDKTEPIAETQSTINDSVKPGLRVKEAESEIPVEKFVLVKDETVPEMPGKFERAQDRLETPVSNDENRIAVNNRETDTEEVSFNLAPKTHIAPEKIETPIVEEKTVDLKERPTFDRSKISIDPPKTAIAPDNSDKPNDETKTVGQTENFRVQDENDTVDVPLKTTINPGRLDTRLTENQTEIGFAPSDNRRGGAKTTQTNHAIVPDKESKQPIHVTHQTEHVQIQRPVEAVKEKSETFIKSTSNNSEREPLRVPQKTDDTAVDRQTSSTGGKSESVNETAPHAVLEETTDKTDGLKTIPVPKNQRTTDTTSINKFQNQSDTASQTATKNASSNGNTIDPSAMPDKATAFKSKIDTTSDSAQKQQPFARPQPETVDTVRIPTSTKIKDVEKIKSTTIEHDTERGENRLPNLHPLENSKAEINGSTISAIKKNGEKQPEFPKTEPDNSKSAESINGKIERPVRSNLESKKSIPITEKPKTGDIKLETPRSAAFKEQEPTQVEKTNEPAITVRRTPEEDGKSTVSPQPVVKENLSDRPVVFPKTDGNFDIRQARNRTEEPNLIQKSIPKNNTIETITHPQQQEDEKANASVKSWLRENQTTERPKADARITIEESLSANQQQTATGDSTPVKTSDTDRPRQKNEKTTISNSIKAKELVKIPAANREMIQVESIQPKEGNKTDSSIQPTALNGFELFGRQIADYKSSVATPSARTSNGSAATNKPIVMMVIDPDDIPDRIKQNQERLVVVAQAEPEEKNTHPLVQNTLKTDRDESTVLDKSQTVNTSKSAQDTFKQDTANSEHDNQDARSPFKKSSAETMDKPKTAAFQFERNPEIKPETIAQNVRLSREAAVLDMMAEPQPAQPAPRSETEQPQTNTNPATQGSHAQAAVAIDNTPEQTPQASMSKFYAEQAAKMQEITSQQIVRSVQGSIGSGRSHISLKLMPETLGQIQIQMTIKNGALTAQIVAQKQTTQAVIEQSLNHLKTAFDDAGIRVDRLSVGKETTDTRLQDQGKDQSGGDRSSRQRSETGSQPGGQQSGNGNRNGRQQTTPFWSDRMKTSDYFF